MNYKKLTDYIGKLNPGKWMQNPQPGNGSKENPFIVPYVSYDEIAMQFYQDIYAVCDEAKINYSGILEKYGIDKIPNLEDYDVSSVDADLLLCLMMHVTRRDRFCEGYFNRFIEAGILDKWLSRLKEIDEKA